MDLMDDVGVVGVIFQFGSPRSLVSPAQCSLSRLNLVFRSVKEDVHAHPKEDGVCTFSKDLHVPGVCWVQNWKSCSANGLKRQRLRFMILFVTSSTSSSRVHFSGY